MNFVKNPEKFLPLIHAGKFSVKALNRVLRSSDATDSVRWMIVDHLQKSNSFTLDTFTAMIDNFTNSPHSNHLDQVKNIYQIMLEQGIKPTQTVCNSVLGAYASAGSITNMEHFYSKVLDMNIKPSAHTRQILLKGYAHAKSFDKAREQFNQLVAPDNTSYNHMLEACNNNMEKSEYYFESMKSPDLLSYQFAMSAVLPDDEKFLKYFDLLMKSCNPKNDDCMSMVYDVLLERGVCPQDQIFLKMIRRSPLQSPLHYEQVKKRILKFDIEAFNEIMYSYMSDTAKVINCFNWIRERDITPNYTSYKNLILACEMAGDFMLSDYLWIEAKAVVDETFCEEMSASLKVQPSRRQVWLAKLISS